MRRGRWIFGGVLGMLGVVVSGAGVRAQSVPGPLETLGDTVLTRLVDQALAANPGLAAAEARVRGARADRFDAALDLAPTVTAVGGYTRQQISGATFPGLGGDLPSQDLWEAGVQMSWELDVFGRTRHALAGRDGLLDAAGEDVRDTRVFLTAEVAAGYFRLRAAQSRLAVARRNADNQRRTLAVTVERLEGGRGTALDTERARAQLSSTLAAMPALEAAIMREQHDLSRLLGREPGTVVDVVALEDAFPTLPRELLLPSEADAVERRPDVIGARNRLSASTSFVRAARADYLPRLSIRGAAGYTASAFDALGSSGTPRYSFGPVISWPLMDLARVGSSVERARANERETRAIVEDRTLRARAEIATSRTEYEMARTRLDHLVDAAEASERAADLARLRFMEGAGDFLEVLDAERRLLEAEDQLVAGRLAAGNAMVGVYRALGLSWGPEGS